MRLLLLFASTLLLAAAVGAAAWYSSRDTLPREVRVAAGQRDGLYYSFAERFAERLRQRTGRRVRVVETAGSEENVRLLQSGGADLALIQTTAPTPEGVVGVAPLFPEPLHFVARKGKDIHAPADLVRKKEKPRVALGLKGSGMRQNADTVLAHYGISEADLRHPDDYFTSLESNGEIDAALVTTGWMNPALERLLGSDHFDLVGLPGAEGLALRHPWLTPVTIPKGLYHGRNPLPSEPVQTVAVTALLAGRADASDELVREALAALYETDLRASFPAMHSAKAARDFDGAVMHPGVVKYHDPSAGLKKLSDAMELASKSKEALFGVGAAALVMWGWLRRRRERIAAATDQVQKQKLDGFIGQTLEVELELREVTEPVELRPLLRRVTRIKQDALRDLTSETVRGDQLFAIFLSQCAALSEKIQMRMIYARLSEGKGG